MKTKAELLDLMEHENVRFLRLWFTDIMGINKNVEVPASQFDKALSGKIHFDGSSIEGFARIEESDMVLSPDLRTFRIFPWEDEHNKGKVARIICDTRNPDGSMFPGCPRSLLRLMLTELDKESYKLMVGPEVEFFLFERNADGSPTIKTSDAGGYFDLAPIDRAEDARREIVQVLESLEYEVEASHHEVAPGQHEIDFKYGDALLAADNIATFRFVVRKIALNHNLHATFMPKPIFGLSGSGMHTNQSLFKENQNTFNDPENHYGLSESCLYYIGGLMKHARAICAIANPLINSYKRLVPNYEAPTMITWSERNRSPLIRVPASRGQSTRVEMRSPDPSANPYLSLAVMLAAGMDGIRNRIDPGEPVKGNLYDMSEEELIKHNVGHLPAHLSEAIDALEADELIMNTLGEHICRNYIKAKRDEWQEYIAQVHDWERDRYLSLY